MQLHVWPVKPVHAIILYVLRHSQTDLEGEAPLVALVIGADEDAVRHAIWLAAAGQHLLKHLLRCLPLSRCAAIMNQSSQGSSHNSQHADKTIFLPVQFVTCCMSAWARIAV